MRRLELRLAFLTSQKIVQRVTECSITGYSEGSEKVGKKPGRCELNVAALDRIMGALIQFPNLRKLCLGAMRIKLEHLDLMAKVLRLTAIELQSCSFLFGAGLAPGEELGQSSGGLSDSGSAIRELICDVEKGCGGLPTSPRILRSIMVPTHLQRLVIGLNNLSFILHFLASSTQFDNLESLCLPVEAMDSSSIIPALRNCSSVTSLTLRYSEFDAKYRLKKLPSHILPNLTTFEGPHCYAVLLSAAPDPSQYTPPIHSVHPQHNDTLLCRHPSLHLGRPLTKLTLRAFSNSSSVCDATSLPHTIRRLHPGIQTLDIGFVRQLTPLLLRTILEQFPMLRALCVNSNPSVHPRGFGIADVIKAFEDVKPRPPRKLRRKSNMTLNGRVSAASERPTEPISPVPEDEQLELPSSSNEADGRNRIRGDEESTSEEYFPDDSESGLSSSDEDSDSDSDMRLTIRSRRSMFPITRKLLPLHLESIMLGVDFADTPSKTPRSRGGNRQHVDARWQDEFRQSESSLVGDEEVREREREREITHENERADKSRRRDNRTIIMEDLVLDLVDTVRLVSPGIQMVKLWYRQPSRKIGWVSWSC
ncbi:hypothetical protein AX16_006545 [Volvariella volvacea WC 439]|nr:hypothetical protein AX16_006545 [Volvariella volvacea WC 439]